LGWTSPPPNPPLPTTPSSAPPPYTHRQSRITPYPFNFRGGGFVPLPADSPLRCAHACTLHCLQQHVFAAHAALRVPAGRTRQYSAGRGQDARGIPQRAAAHTHAFRWMPRATTCPDQASHLPGEPALLYHTRGQTLTWDTLPAHSHPTTTPGRALCTHPTHLPLFTCRDHPRCTLPTHFPAPHLR